MTDALEGVRPGVGALLRDLDRAPPAELVETCAAWLQQWLSAPGCVLLLADYSEVSLEPVPAGDTAYTTEVQDMLTSPAGRAYREQRRVHHQLGEPDPVQVVYLPVSIRAERLGVLTVTLPGRGLDGDTAAVLDDVAQVLGYVLTGARRYTDRFEMLRRRRALGLAAEIQWELLPSLAYELPGFSIAGALEPAYDIGGDSFDYAVSAHRLTVSITDGVGRGVRAALLASLTCTAMRNARRSHAGIAEQAHAANQHLAEQFPGPSFVTGLLLELDIDTGAGTILNAGHPPPFVLRDGAVTELAIPPNLPLGLFPTTTYTPHPLQLRPGDRVLLITDGITEAHPIGGPSFGDPRLTDILTTHPHLPPAEFVRHLTRAVVDFRDGELTDDATAVCLDWRPRTSPGHHTQHSTDLRPPPSAPALRRPKSTNS
ncbi:MAG TPA: GAF domain-containing SpoIIE family protein phosphatase [Pseudonocardiaceae bacterium]